jgi:transcriptional regulator with XRE-family HTH domain
MTAPLPMPAREARAILRRLGWFQHDAAERLGVAPRTMRQWLEKEASLPAPHAELLRHLEREMGK